MRTALRMCQPLAGRGMSCEEFLAYWRRTYHDIPLVGWRLREFLPRRWFRIHSLPKSKRYATTDAERREILRRQTRLFDDLVGESGPCEMVFSYLGEKKRLPKEVLTALLDLEPEFLLDIPAKDSGCAGRYRFLKASFAWKKGCLDTILRAVAHDVMEGPIFVSTANRRILAPYDGGVDIIAESTASRDRLKVRYSRWLPKHPEGL